MNAYPRTNLKSKTNSPLGWNPSFANRQGKNRKIGDFPVIKIEKMTRDNDNEYSKNRKNRKMTIKLHRLLMGLILY